MSTWKTALTLSVAAALVATTAFAQTTGGANPSKPSTDTTSKPSDSPSAAPKTSDADKSPTTGSSPSTTPGASSTTPGASSTTPGATTSDSTKSDTMKSDSMKADKMSKGRGMRSAGGNREHVKAVQQALKDKGHDPGNVDGVLGPKTRTALKDFQKKEGIKDTGRLDQETMAKLGVDAKSSSAPSSSSSGSASPATSTPSATPGASSSDSSSSTTSGGPSGSGTEKK